MVPEWYLSLRLFWRSGGATSARLFFRFSGAGVGFSGLSAPATTPHTARWWKMVVNGGRMVEKRCRTAPRRPRRHRRLVGYGRTSGSESSSCISPISDVHYRRCAKRFSFLFEIVFSMVEILCLFFKRCKSELIFFYCFDMWCCRRL